MNSKLRCTVVARIYTWNIRVLNDPIKRNKVICYFKDHKILHFIRIQSMHKVKAYMSVPGFFFCIYEPEELVFSVIKLFKFKTTNGISKIPGLSASRLYYRKLDNMQLISVNVSHP